MFAIKLFFRIFLLACCLLWSNAYSQSDNLALQDTTINSKTNFLAKNSITLGPNFTISSNGNVAFSTGNFIAVIPKLSILKNGELQFILTTIFPPSATTDPASNVSGKAATLNGTVNANNSSTTVKFEYGTTTSYGNEITATQSPINGTNPVSISAQLSGLTPNTTYHFRIVATNTAGLATGSDMTFTTIPVPPTASTAPATNITQSSVALNGSVNANGLSTTVKFQYGTTTSYGNEVTATPSPVSGTNSISVSANLSGLVPNTTYHYRIVATNSAGNTAGSDITFTSGVIPPTATTEVATNVTESSATLNGSVIANGLSTTVKFQYGRTKSYGNEITANPSPVNSTNAITVGANLSGLSPNAAYHYRVIATNSAGTSTGLDITFTTGIIPPSVSTEPASNASATTALLHGNVNPNGSDATTIFQYGITTGYGNKVDASPSLVSGATLKSVSAQLINLTPNTTYHYRAAATNSAGLSEGADVAFTTGIIPPTAITQAADNVTETTATLKGIVNANNLTTSVKFEYGATTSYGNEVSASPSTVNGVSQEAVSVALIGLAPNTTYHYRVVASNNAGTEMGSNQTFSTNIKAPTVETQEATNVTESSADLNGTVNPNGLSTTVIFEYGTSAGYGNQAPANESPADGASAKSMTAHITSLKSNTTYHYRVAAENSAGTNSGSDMVFTFTKKASVTVDPAENVTANTVQLKGTVNPHNLLTTVKFEYGISTSYGNKVSATPSPVDGESEYSVIADIDGLISNTLYHCRVEANNSAGEMLSADLTFRTGVAPPIATTLPATDVLPDAAVLRGVVNPNNASTKVKFEYGTTDSYGFKIDASPNDVTGSIEESVRSILDGLTPNSTYHYRVVATNNGGPSYGEDVEFITDAKSATVKIQPITNTKETTATLNALVNPHNSITTIKFKYGTTQDYKSETTPQLKEGTVPIPVNVDLTDLSPDKVYHYRIVATNMGGTTESSDQTFKTYTASYTLTKIINFRSHPNDSQYDSTYYQLFGLPGDGRDLSIKELMSGEYEKDWRAFWDNGSPDDGKKGYLIEYKDNPDTFNLLKGKAFWVLKKGNLEILNKTVEAAALNDSGEVEIPLHPGWNMFTNPFTEKISWKDVRDANAITRSILMFNGSSFPSSTTFDPYIGYYFFNATNLEILKIPFKPLLSSSALPKIADPATWRVYIVLKSEQSGVDSSTSIGMASNSSQQLDLLDHRKPRAIGKIASSYFHRSQWDSLYSVFASDIRPPFDKKETWQFNVDLPNKEPAQLAFPGIAKVPAEFDIYLLDEIYARYVDLRQDSVYSFIPKETTSQFSIVVGSILDVDKELSALLPTDFSLGLNYPNPFNPSTNIPIAVRLPASITLKIYNTLGQQVRTLFDGPVEAGWHTFTWDCRNDFGLPMPSGLYFYRLNSDAGDRGLVGKMILIK